MLLSMAYEPKYNTIIGLGHATYGSNPDYTYDHYGKFEKENLVGFGDWTVNEQRSLIEQEQVYKKLVEYNKTVLKNNNKVVPWDQLSSYLTIFNNIRENHDNSKHKGSLDGLKKKVTYLENLLNGKITKVQTYKEYGTIMVKDKIITINPPKLGLRKKDKLAFELINKIQNTINYGAGKDGCSIPQALTNRTTSLSLLSKDPDFSSFKNVIWDTSVSGYETKDGEDPAIVNNVRGYQFTFPKNLIIQIYNPNGRFIVTGKPAAGTIK